MELAVYLSMLEQGDDGAMAWLVAHPDRSRPRLRAILERPLDQRDETTWRAMEVLVAIGNGEDVAAIDAHFRADHRNVYLVAHRLREHPSTEAFEALVRGTESSDEQVATAAISVLPERTEPGARSAVERALAHPLEAVRFVAVRALHRMGPAASRDALVRRRAVEPVPSVRSEIDFALSGARHDDARTPENSGGAPIDWR